MKYTQAYYVALIADNKLKTFAELRAKFPAQHLYYSRHGAVIGPIPLVKTKRANNSLTLEECKALASKFAYKSEFQSQSKGAYLTALRKGWLPEVCAHMVAKPFAAKGGNPGKPAHNRKDLSGKIFGSWTVVSQAEKRPGYKDIFWHTKCVCGTESVIRGHNLRMGTTTKCTNCSNQISKPMKDIHAFLLGLGVDAKLSYREFGFEIDIYVPDKKFFIEYDGLLWHSSKFRNTEAAERSRYKQFKQAGLTGIRIFEDQWLNSPELVKRMIAHRLGCGPATKPAEVIFELCENPSSHRAFCEQSHIDGYGRSSWAIVAKSGETVLAFMGFRPYMSGPHKGQLELSRFCTNHAYNCYGLFGKMLKLAKKHIKSNQLAKVIVSASDNCISDGKVYMHNGFKLAHIDNSLNWYYYLHSKGLRMHRARGKKLKPPQITVAEYSQYPTESLQASSGFLAEKRFGRREPLHKIWGWGQKLWITNV